MRQVIHFGWKQQKYFPSQVAMSFVESCIHFENSCNVLDCFLEFIAPSEAEVVCKALENYSSLTANEIDEFEEFRSAYNCTTDITPENIHATITKLATYNLIHKSSFI